MSLEENSSFFQPGFIDYFLDLFGEIPEFLTHRFLEFQLGKKKTNLLVNPNQEFWPENQSLYFGTYVWDPMSDWKALERIQIRLVDTQKKLQNEFIDKVDVDKDFKDVSNCFNSSCKKKWCKNAIDTHLCGLLPPPI